MVSSLPFIPEIRGFPLICLVSTGGFFDSLELLNGFLKQGVVSRMDLGIRKWVNWLREDLSSRPYAWLRPDFVLLVLLSRILRLSQLVSWSSLILLMLSFAKLGCFFFLSVWSSCCHS